VEGESGEHGSVTDNIQAERWFSQDIFKHLNRIDDSEGYAEKEGNEVVIENELRDEDLPVMPLPERTKRRLKRKAETERRSLKKSRQELKGANPVAEDEGSGKFETVPVEPPKAPMNSQELAEIQALGSLMIHRKSRMDLIDGAYNRYAFNDDPLPEWFADEESKHNTPDLPVTKELVQEFKAKLREIHDRPIKKVVEAQARKKKREQRRMSKVKKQAKVIAESPEHNEGSKARSIRKLMLKARNAEKDQDKRYVVSRRSGVTTEAKNKGGKIKGNSAVKVVDKRLKKDKRNRDRNAKKGGKKRHF